MLSRSSTAAPRCESWTRNERHGRSSAPMRFARLEVQRFIAQYHSWRSRRRAVECRVAQARGLPRLSEIARFRPPSAGFVGLRYYQQNRSYFLTRVDFEVPGVAIILPAGDGRSHADLRSCR